MAVTDPEIVGRLAEWRRELKSWKIGGLSIQMQEYVILELNHLYSKSVEVASPLAGALMFGDKGDPYLGGLFIGRPDKAERVFRRIRLRNREGE